MSWVNPFAWLSLSALALPLFIHYLNRSQGRHFDFAAVRFLQSRTSSRLSFLNLNELVLLLWRSLLIFLLAVLLAKPELLTGKAEQDGLLLVTPKAQRYAAWADLQQISEQAGLPLRQLQPGFPLVDQQQQAPHGPALMAGLALSADQLQLDRPVQVIYLDHQYEFDYQKLKLAASYQFHAVPPMITPARKQLAIRYSTTRLNDARMIEAALLAASQTGLADFEVSLLAQESPVPELDVLIDLSRDPIDANASLLIVDELEEASQSLSDFHWFSGFRYPITLNSSSAQYKQTQVLLRTETNIPIATIEKMAGNSLIRWHGRLSLQQVPMMREAQFPGLLSQLINRWVVNKPEKIQFSGHHNEKRLGFIVIVLILLVWILERYWAERSDAYT